MILERIEWIFVVVWRGLVEIIEKYIYKGSKLYIEGRFIIWKYEINDGQKRIVFEIVVESIEMFDFKWDVFLFFLEFEQKLSYNL